MESQERQQKEGRSADLSAETLRWAIGLLCCFIGAFVLIAPHHFYRPSYEALLRYRVAWGGAALLAGFALLASAVLRPRRSLVLGSHGLAGLVLLILAAGFSRGAAWSGVISYSVLGIGLLVSSFPYGDRKAETGRGDLFAFLMGIVATLLGGVLVLFPRVFPAPIADHNLTAGLPLLLTGLPLAWAQWGNPPRRLLSSIHLLAGLSIFTFGALVAFPNRAWTGIAFYCGAGCAIACLPWLRTRFDALDATALRTQLALSLAIAMSLALILAVAVVSAQEERLAARQAEDTQQTEVRGVAQDVFDFVLLNGARAATVAAMAGRLPMTAPAQQALLASLSLPGDAAAFFVLDPAGRKLSRLGSADLGDGSLAGAAAGLDTRSQTALSIALDRRTRRQTLLLAVPIVGLDGRLAGALVSALDPASLERRIARQDSTVSLADGQGLTLAESDGTRGAAPTDPPPARPKRLPRGWDRAWKNGLIPVTGERLTAFASVPTLGWVVAAERSRDLALAGVRRGRDSAFILLLVVLPLAAAGGIAAARRITRPLGTLAAAVGEMTAGNHGAPLAPSEITEVAQLSAAFGEMRDRLARRTAEGEQLAVELRARAEMLADSDRRKDEFLAMLAHELRNPLGAISSASYVLAQTGAGEGPSARSVAIIQRQILHLVRLVDDLLDVSRITRGKVELRRERIDLVAVVEQAVEMTRPVVDAKSHALTLSLPPSPVPVHGDATRLEQVVVNLIRNAATFTEPGGRIDVALRLETESAEAVVSVTDTGVGIPADLMPRIFDLFTQGRQELDRSAGGLGIGLTLVRTLVELHGGRVEGQSEGPGKGSEFRVGLPLAERAVVVAEPRVAEVSATTQ